MFSDLGEEDRTRFRKKKRKKKEKREKKEKKRKKPHDGKSGLVGIKRYPKTYNRVKYFLPYFEPFFNETAFYTKLLKRFSGLKPKPRD